MIDKMLLVKFYAIVPDRQRSDFLNRLLEEALIDWSRKSATEQMDEIRALNKKRGVRLSTEEFIKLKNYGRA